MKNGKKDSLKNGKGNKYPDGTNNSVGSKASGSRFEVLNEEVEQNAKTGKGIKKITKKADKLGVKKAGCQGNVSYYKGPQDQLSPVLDTESDGQNNATVLRFLHKEGRESESKCDVVVDGGSSLVNQSIARMHIDDSFTAVASNLEEAMAVITE
ncbi:hypothetical protein Q3G72_020261 [Acer saccharum]|nr:hypothetical protein Q3G72_020261 [Acer saccharum]